jgi:hypothetical protein
MGRKRAFSLETLVFSVVFNGVLLACLYGLARQVLIGIQDSMAPVAATGLADLPEQLRAAATSLGAFIDRNRRLMAPVVFGLGGLTTLALWLSVQLAGRRLLAEEGSSAAEEAGQAEDSLKKEVKRLEKEVQAAKKAASKPSPAPAIQVLSILQRQGRLIDFLAEDLGQYEDSQIGAAVRSIHQGCKEALSKNVELEAVLGEEEGAEMTIQAGFDPEAIRLTGNVQGDPPFRGTLRHRGWRVVRVDLPLKAPDRDKDWILAPAEIEIGE